MGRKLWDIAGGGIYVEEIPKRPQFTEQVFKDLNLIRSNPIGRDLLILIGYRSEGIGTKQDAGKIVVIGKCAKARETRADNAAEDPVVAIRRLVPGRTYSLAGGGCGCNVYYNPTLDYTKAIGVLTPSYIALAHELIHAFHALSGDFDERSHPTDGRVLLAYEEARTVGLSIYENTRISENTIRKENGLPLRTNYSGCDFTKMPSALGNQGAENSLVFLPRGLEL